MATLDKLGRGDCRIRICGDQTICETCRLSWDTGDHNNRCMLDQMPEFNCELYRAEMLDGGTLKQSLMFSFIVALAFLSIGFIKAALGL